jgi:hypothetical protein
LHWRGMKPVKLANPLLHFTFGRSEIREMGACGRADLVADFTVVPATLLSVSPRLPEVRVGAVEFDLPLAVSDCEAVAAVPRTSDAGTGRAAAGEVIGAAGVCPMERAAAVGDASS